MPDFPAAEIAFTKFKVKVMVACEYELNNMADYEAVKEDVESALSTLRQLGSAEVTFTADKSEVKPKKKGK